MSCRNTIAPYTSHSLPVSKAELKDFQALMDHFGVMNGSTPAIGELSSDNYHFSRSQWLTLTRLSQEAFIWHPLTYGRWAHEYEMIMTSNIALEGLTKIQRQRSNQAEWDLVKGCAHFYRAAAFFNLAQIFIRPFDSIFSKFEPGVPLSLSTDKSIVYIRGTVQETYDQIISDLDSSLLNLPVVPRANATPSFRSAHGMLARVYLAMGKYDKAFSHADLALKENSYLLDYSSLDKNALWPMPAPLTNKEIAILTYMEDTGIIAPVIQLTDLDLYQSYDPADLRKALFFTIGVDGDPIFKGSYSGNSTCFSGIANDELFLTRAECYARAGRTTGAMLDLNTLLAKRYENGRFIPLLATSPEQALTHILRERRKELVHRGLRWMDLKRLNKDARFAVTLKRKIGDLTFTLPPDDDRYLFLMPIKDVNWVLQNPRENIFMDNN